MKKLFTLLLFASTLAIAQWNYDITENLPVTSKRSTTSNTVGTSDGKTYVFFYEIGEASTMTPRVQLLDKDGVKQFGENGILINDITPLITSSQPMDMVVDSENNLYATFVASNNQIYLQKIEPTGNLPWGNSGIVVSAAGGLYPKILPLSNSVIVTYDSFARVAQIVKFDKETGASSWATPLAVGNIGGLTRTTLMEFSKLSDDSFVAVFQGRVNNFATTGKLYAQRYDSNGVALWNAPVEIHSATGVPRISRFTHFVDSSDNFYIAYNSNLNASTLKYDAYVQKITPNGEIPWGMNGIDITTDNYSSESNPVMAIDGDYIWAMATGEINDGTSKRGEVVQKINKNTGALAFDEIGKIVFVPQSGADANMRMSTISFLNGKPTFVIVDNNDIAVNPIVLSVVSLNQDGEIYSNNPITSASAKARISAVAKDNQIVVAWEDKRTDGFEQIYAQNFKTDVMATQNSIKNNEVRIYPNPVVSELTVLSNSKIKLIELFDQSGRVIVSSKKNVLSLQKYPAGLYILKTTFEDSSTITSKIIKK